MAIKGSIDFQAFSMIPHIVSEVERQSDIRPVAYWP